MKVLIIFDDWRRVREGGSIYQTELGVRLSAGILHSGTTWTVELVGLPDEVTDEIRQAYDEHRAYPVFRVLPVKECSMRMTNRQRRALRRSICRGAIEAVKERLMAPGPSVWCNDRTEWEGPEVVEDCARIYRRIQEEIEKIAQEEAAYLT